MHMKHMPITICLLACTLAAQAQDFNFTHETEWSEQPAMHAVHAAFDSMSAVGILDDRKLEIKKDKQALYTYYTDHSIFKVRNDRGIELYNKVYIYMPPNAELVSLKARTILPSGKVLNIDILKVKEMVEEGKRYKLFAAEGLEKNAELEYQYTLKRDFNLFGSETMQSSRVPYQESHFTLITPEHLRYSAKGYNGYAVSTDSLINGRRIITGYANDIARMEEEKYAYSSPYLKRVEYKLSYNTSANPDTRLYTWKEFGKKAFAVYTTATEKEQKAVANLAKSIRFTGNEEAGRIIAVEEHIKSNINIDEGLLSEDAEDIEKILKHKAANHKGTARLFAVLFDQLAIPYQLVFPADRDSYPIDEELENWNRADEVLFYFPALGKYLSPTSVSFRYPFIPFNLAATRGIFLKGTRIGDFRTAIASFNEVAMEPFEQHTHNLEAEVSLLNEDTLLVRCRQLFTGYGAAGLRPAYAYLPKDKLEEFNKGVVQAVINSNNISHIVVENAAFSDVAGNKPLVIAADIKTADLVEKAGNRLLVKIGEVIGEQTEMYQDKPRQLPVELAYPHALSRQITFHIPDGYTVQNAADLNLNIVEKEGDTVTLGFTSSYTQNGNDLVIRVEETYHNIRYPLEAFEKFRQVINASADFNKIVLVLLKK